MLISDSYIELQKDLHARYEYGKGVDAPECALIVRGLLPEGSTVLDYGCGQGHLARILTDYEMEEYDPCIEGKDEEPARCDAVVCADVLEHIEPYCLDEVLKHIQLLAKKYVVLVIASKPSKKVMKDGRTAHLIVEGRDWWLGTLTRYFFIDGFNDRSEDGKGFLIAARPKPLTDSIIQIPRIRAITAVDNEKRNQNVRTNSARISKRVALDIPAHDRVAHLVCYGPSLKETWPAVAMAHAVGEDVFTVSGAHRFLLDRNVIPYAHLDCDPRPHKVEMLGEPDKRVKYWLASCVDPSFLNKLEGCDVSLWHSYNGKESKPTIREVDPKQHIIVGGGSVGLRAMSVLYCMGYRTFHIHGMDCSFKDDEHHAGPHLGKNNGPIPIKCGNEWFQSNGTMLLYARYFRKQMQMMKDATVHLHGDGLLQAMNKGE